MKMKGTFLMILLAVSTSILTGQNLSYDFTNGNTDISGWRSVVKFLHGQNYEIPNADSLTGDGLILMSSSEQPTFLKLATDTDILPGWRGDIIEVHEPYYIKYATSKIKVMLMGAGGDILAAESSVVNWAEPGSANLVDVECTDPMGCYVELIMWSHDTIESTALNRLKKIEVRSKAHETTYDFTEHDPILWQSNFGELIPPRLKQRSSNPLVLQGPDGYSSSFKWVSKRVVAFGWFGNIIENHRAENVYWAGSIDMSLTGISTNRIMAQANTTSEGNPIGKADLFNVECNDPLGCYIEVELSGDKGPAANELESIQIIENSAPDKFDVGVFYMPFWHNDYGSAYWNSTQKDHRWYIIDRYNREMEAQGHEATFARVPLDIYKSSGSPAHYYNEEDVSVNQQQLSLMKEYGIDYVIYDSYFHYYKQNTEDTVYNAEKWAPFWNQVVKNVSQLGSPAIPFSIMWASDFTTMVYDPKNRESPANPRGCRGFFEAGGGFDRLVNHWDSLLANPNYKKVDGKPVVYIYYSGSPDPALGGHTNSLEGLCDYCSGDPFFDPLGSARYEANLNSNKTAFLLSRIKEKIGKDIFFVAVVSSAVAWQDPLKRYDWYLDYPIKGGFDAVTSYGMSAFDGSDLFVNASWWNWDWGYDYERMTGAYAKYYSYLLNQNYSTLTSNNFEFHLPVTAGFNRGPLNLHENRGNASNGYAVNIWDQAVSNPTTFEKALTEAKEYISGYPNQTGRNVAICCWNEYAEGTVIEPTTYWKYSYLEKVQQVFSGELPIEEGEGVELKVIEASESKHAKEDTSAGFETEEIIMLTPVFNEKEPHYSLNIYPNPIERTANIRFNLLEKTTASIQILNAMGQVVQDLLNSTVESGKYEIQWDASSKPKGFYFCRIITNDFVEVKKLVLTH